MNDRPNPEPDGLTHIGADGARMVDVAGKPMTVRQATAEAVVPVNNKLAAAIRNRTHRKGDVLTVAQLAGIQAVKHTAMMIPLCHPLPIDGVDVNVTLHDVPTLSSVHITATVRTTAKTGVEMEALHAASVAALTLIDMGKAVQRDLAIQHIRLLEKTGGQHGDYRATDAANPTPAAHQPRPAHASPTADGGTPQSPWPALRCAVLTVSDRAAAGTYEDRSGPAITHWLTQHVGSKAQRIEKAIVPDEADALRVAIQGWCDTQPGVAVDLLLTTGGTGLAPRDITPEVTTELIDRAHPGLAERARQVTAAEQPLACLSRGIAGVRRQTLIINLPGSPRACVEWLDALAPALPHALKTLQTTQAVEHDG